jgi:hypothetical protein
VRALVAACAIMGVLIVVGVAVLGVVAARRIAGGAARAPMALAEPEGTRIAAADGPPDALTLLLSGGGPDRVVVVDALRGRVRARVVLTAR